MFQTENLSMPVWSMHQDLVASLISHKETHSYTLPSSFWVYLVLGIKEDFYVA